MRGYFKVAKDPRSTLLLKTEDAAVATDDDNRKTPFLYVPHQHQSDFLYVPTNLTSQYEAVAEILIDHDVFLECGIPKIAEYLTSSPSLVGGATRLETVKLCTSWYYDTRGKLNMITECRPNKGPPHDAIHPFKLTQHGYKVWGDTFDWAIAGTGQLPVN